MKRAIAAVAVVSLAALFSTWVPAGALQVTTPYPVVNVEAGKSVSLNLKVLTPTPQRVDLAVVQAPPGWQTTLRGGGFIIGGVFGDDENPPEVKLEVLVPPDAAAGDHQVVVRATGAGTQLLPVVLRVSEKGAAGAVSLTADFPTLRGKPDTTYTFKLTLSNNTPEKTTFALAAEGPPGWAIEARPTAETRAATLSVDGGSTGTVEVTADPPDQATAQQYPIRVKASGGGKEATADLNVEITGNVTLEVTTPSERLNVDARAGRRTRMELVIRNTGSGPAQNVKLSSTPPTGWKLDFDKETVPSIAPQRSARVGATLTPSGNAVAGDYDVTVTAAGEGATDNVEMRVTVKASRFWFFVGILIILGTLFGLRWIFGKYGRR